MKILNLTLVGLALLVSSVSMAGLSLPPETIKTEGLSLPPDEQGPPIRSGEPVVMILPDGTAIEM